MKSYVEKVPLIIELSENVKIIRSAKLKRTGNEHKIIIFLEFSCW